MLKSNFYFLNILGDLGIYSLSIQRHLFDIHYALAIDRPTLMKPLLNSQMLSFATKVNFIQLITLLFKMNK